ncbi:MAG TPA: DinB family protein [Gemmatimonadaceae bacterium]|nr:DinB family protein [Gemmatimonadaceae bacterium]
MSTRAELIATYASAPDRLRAAVRELSEEQIAAPRDEGKWSVHQLCVHLADSDLHGLLRIRRILAQPGSELQTFDQDAWVESLAGVTSTAAAVDAFALCRRMGTELFLAAWPESWRFIGRHPERGPMGLDAQLELLAWHGDHHIDQIVEFRRRMEW